MTEPRRVNVEADRIIAEGWRERMGGDGYVTWECPGFPSRGFCGMRAHTTPNSRYTPGPCRCGCWRWERVDG